MANTVPWHEALPQRGYTVIDRAVVFDLKDIQRHIEEKKKRYRPKLVLLVKKNRKIGLGVVRICSVRPESVAEDVAKWMRGFVWFKTPEEAEAAVDALARNSTLLPFVKLPATDMVIETFHDFKIELRKLKRTPTKARGRLNVIRKNARGGK